MTNILPVSDLRNYNEVLKNCRVGRTCISHQKWRADLLSLTLKIMKKTRAERKLLLKLQEAEDAVKDESQWLSLDELKTALED